MRVEGLDVYRLLGKVLFHDAADGDDMLVDHSSAQLTGGGARRYDDDVAAGSVPVIARGETPVEYLLTITEPHYALIHDDDDVDDFHVESPAPEQTDDERDAEEGLAEEEGEEEEGEEDAEEEEEEEGAENDDDEYEDEMLEHDDGSRAHSPV